jgi:hypothetical protein
VSAIFGVFLDWLDIIEDLLKDFEDKQAHDRVSREGQEVQVDAYLRS